ncbi:hypothetical protein COB64_04380 [Candidatus Wolfebacteria bacterium]|nr:MAG: hypothetical protein COB64_04380 [Candidatus Wolfebacteria bacterium]
MISLYLNKFWKWYERNLLLNTVIAASLFFWQLIHLYWLFDNVILFQIFGASNFNVTGIWESIIIIFDYVEIPSIIIVSIFYINELRKGFSWKPVLFLIFLNIQWLHLFWITDQFVIDQLINPEHQPILPMWLAWVAIFIDYLELPVIYDTMKKAFIAIKNKVASRNL